MNGVKLDSVQRVKDFIFSNALNLKFSRQCEEATGQVNIMLGFISRNFSLKNEDIILSLYISLVRPHLEYAVQFLSPHHTKYIAKLEAVQQRATKMIKSLRNKSCKERLGSQNPLLLGKRQLRSKLTECFEVRN